MASAGNVYRITGPNIAGVDPAIRSVRYWLWPDLPSKLADTGELPATLAGFQACHYLEFQGYSTVNASGAIISPLNHISQGPGMTIWDAYGVDVTAGQAVENLLRAAFPAPGPD